MTFTLGGRPQSEIDARTKLIRADFGRVSKAPGLREQLFNKQSGKCFWCTKDLQGPDSIFAQFDHYTSMYLFAAWRDLSDADAIQQANAKSNLVVAHPSCNRAKDMLDADEFRERLESGEINLDEPRRWTPEEIEREKQRHSANSRKGGLKTARLRLGIFGRSKRQIRKDNQKGGRIRGRQAVKSGQLASVCSIGARNQPREAKIKGGRIGGRIQGRKNVESGHIQALGREAVESGQLASITTYKSCAKGGRKRIELHGNPGTSAGRRKGGRIAGRIGGPISTHKRWHTNRGIFNPNCDLCRREGQKKQ